MTMDIHIENLPRTIELVADEGGPVHYEIEPSPFYGKVQDFLDRCRLVRTSAFVDVAVEDDSRFAGMDCPGCPSLPADFYFRLGWEGKGRRHDCQCKKGQDIQSHGDFCLSQSKDKKELLNL